MRVMRRRSPIGKFIVFADTRDQALARMRVAVSEGITTNIPFYRELLAHPMFCRVWAGIHHLEALIGYRHTIGKAMQ